WHEIRWTVNHILELGLRSGPQEIPIGKRKDVWSIIEPLTDDSDPSPSQDYKPGDDFGDALTRAINTIRGQAIDLVIDYAYWVRRSEQSPTVSGPENEGDSANLGRIREVRKTLQIHLDPGYDPSVAIRAIYGMRLPSLVVLDKNWLRTIIGGL